MSKERFTLPIALAAAGLLVLVVAAAPAAAAPAEPVGDQISVLLPTPTTFAAGAPFHIQHGWGSGGSEPATQAGIYGFGLDVDGAPRAADTVVRTAAAPPTTVYDGPLLTRQWLFDFPGGMTGTHTFTGHWIAPCGTAVAELGYPGPCATPNAPVEAITRSLTVTFVRQNLALGKPVTASSEYPGNPASDAVDGSWWSYWNSGSFPPQWIEVDLGAVQRVGEVDLGITQLPDCTTDHRLYGRASASDPDTLLQEFNGYTVDQQLLRYVAAMPQQLRFIRVETTSSCSWVAWREIEVYGTAG
jgi:F5/8 type C domain